MRIAVDARALSGTRGVTRYTRALIDAIARQYPDDRLLLFVPGRSPVPAADALAALPNVSVRRHPLPGRLLFGAAALTGRPRLDRLAGERPDVVWAPTVAPIAISRTVPLALTVQDLSFELRPGDFTRYERVWHTLARPRALARHARRVIVLAEPTRGLLTERWGLDPAAIEVIPPGISVPSHRLEPESELRRLGLEQRGYLLAVGALEPRKAPETLARAYARARADGLQAQLVFAGDGRLADRLAGPGVRLLGRVSDEQLDVLYGGAIALVMPSWLEGYGLPVREALAHGTPAVVSDLPVFGPELSAAVLRVAPGDEGALAAALVSVAADPVLRERLSAAARPTVSGLSWSEAATRTRQALANAIL